MKAAKSPRAPKFSVLAVTLLFFGCAFSAYAHATPVSYSPQASSLVETPPAEISIRFSERIDDEASSIAVFGPDGSRAEKGHSFVAGNDPRTYIVKLATLDKEGTYAVSWSVLSADDGHFTKGAFTFSLGKVTAPPPGQDLPSQSQVIFKSQFSEGVSIWTELLGQALLLASLLLFLLYIRTLFPSISPETKESIRSRLTLLSSFGVFLILVGGSSYIAAKSLNLAEFQSMPLASAVITFIQSTAGSYTACRMLLALLSGAIIIGARKKIWSKETKAHHYALLGFMLLMLLGRARVSHAAASTFYPFFSIAVTFIQLFAKELWVGGLLVLTSILPLLAKEKNNSTLLLLLTSFSTLAAMLLLLVGLSGVYIVWLDLKDAANIFTSDWGTRFLALFGIANLLVVLRFFQTIIIETATVHSFTKQESNVSLLTRALRHTFPLEAATGIVLLYVTSFMIITTPPLLRTHAYKESSISQGAVITLSDHPYESKNLIITAAHEKTGEPVKPKNIVITALNQEKGIGPIVIDAEKRAENRYVFPISSLSPSGNWSINITFQRDDAYDVVGSFALDTQIFAGNNNGAEEKRTFDLFAKIMLGIAVVIVFGSLLFYAYARRLKERARAIFTNSQTLLNTANPSSVLSGKASWLAIVAVALIGCYIFSEPEAFGSLTKSNLQKKCERDGNIWHYMVPVRGGSIVSETSAQGCMTPDGQYLFTDEREYDYFVRPQNAKADLIVLPENITAGTPARLTFNIQNPDTGKPVEDLVLSHERLLHVIIIGEDLASFSHIHAEDGGAVTPDIKKRGEYTLAHTFPKAGRYLIAVDFAVNAKTFSQTFAIEISGTERLPAFEKNIQASKIFADGYQVSLNPITTIAGRPTTLSYVVKKNGEELGDLQPYLAAAMHIAVVKSDFSSFTHAHGEVHTPGAPIQPPNPSQHFHAPPPSAFGPYIEAHVTFPEAGLYAVFGEIKHEGRIIVTKFLIEAN